jgi:hypothetical protein
VRAIFLSVLAALVLLACFLAVDQAAAHHQSDAPTKLRVIERVYPDLHKRELAREGTSWNRLRRMAWSRWRATHPAAERDHELERLAAIGAPWSNRALARLFFGESYWCAAEIIEGETAGTWDHTIWNYAGSGAYGLGQALPRSKMLAYGADAYTNPLTQLVWFEAYAQARYGSVCGASAHWNPVGSW